MAISTNESESIVKNRDGGMIELSSNKADDLELYKIEQQIVENKLRHELIQYQLKTTEQQLADMNETIELSKLDYQQTSVEVQNCKIETREVKSELYDLKNFTTISILKLNERLDQLLNAASEMDFINIAKNVQLVLDQYINAKISNEENRNRDYDDDDADDDDNNNDDDSSDDNDNDDDDEQEEEEVEGGNENGEDAMEVDNIREGEGGDIEDAKYANHPQVQNGEDGEFKYSLAKDVQTVDKIWIEYARGIHGGPSIKELELKYQTKWRHKMENSTFLRRKRIYKAIEFAIDNLGYDENDAIEELENWRFDKVENRKRPMYWLYDNIPAKFKPNG